MPLLQVRLNAYFALLKTFGRVHFQELDLNSNDGKDMGQLSGWFSKKVMTFPVIFKSGDAVPDLP